jgi:hypothetical protein
VQPATAVRPAVLQPATDSNSSIVLGENVTSAAQQQQ